ncbi:MAG: hypothetical protein ACYDDB_01295 [bacterium]
MKKIGFYAVVGLTVGFMVMGLAGCAKKYGMQLHTEKYYEHHQKQMIAVINHCQKVESGIRSFNEADKFHKSNLYKDCSNAQVARDGLARKSLGKSIAGGW